MADLEKTVEIIFGAVDKTGGTISSISNNVEGFADGVSTVSGPLSDFADLALKTEAAIVGLGVAMLGVAVNESAKLNASLNEIGTLYNATPEQVDAMKASIKDYARESVFSFEDITQSTYDMVSATGDAEGAVDALAVAEQAAVVGATDLGVSVDALTTVLNAYGLGLDSSNDVMGAFIVAVQNGKTTLPELSEAIGRVASTAAAAEVPFDDLLAATAALTAGGVKTAESMTLLQALLKELVDPSDDLVTALGGMSLETNTLQEVMQQLQRATGGSFEEMNQLFGSIEATKGAIILAADSSGTFERALDGMGNKANVVAQNFGLMEENLQLVTQNMQNNLRATIESIGQELLPQWTEIVQSISDIFAGVDVGLDNSNFDQVFSALNAFQVAVEEYADGIAAALPEAMEGLDFTGLLDAFGDLRQTIGDIFGDLDLTDAEDLESALQFVIDSIETLTRVVDGIVESWQPAIDQIINLVNEVNTAGEDSQKLAGIIAGVGQQFELFKGLITGSAEALDAAGTALTVIAGSSVANTLTNMSRAAGPLAAALGKTGLAGAAITAAGATGYTVGSGLSWAIDGLVNAFTDSENSLGTWIYEITHSGEEAESSSAKVGMLTDEVEGLNKATADPKQIKIDVDAPDEEVRDYAAEVNNAFEEQYRLEEGMQAFNAQMQGLGLTFKGTADDADGLTGEWSKQADAADRAAGSGLNYEIVIDALGNKTLVATDAMQKTTKAIESSGKTAKQTATEAQELREKLLELASDERIAAMEFTANIEVAEIETQARRVEAAFESISESVNSTATATTDLFALLADPNLSLSNKLDVQNAAERQLELQEKALDQQSRLIDAEVALMNERTRLLRDGGGVINLNADNLAPELQLVLRSLIDNIRLEAVEQGLEILT